MIWSGPLHFSVTLFGCGGLQGPGFQVAGLWSYGFRVRFLVWGLLLFLAAWCVGIDF